MESNRDRSKWGRVRFGDGHLSAMKVAIPIGVAISVMVGVLAVWMDIAGPRPLLGGAVFTIVMSVSFIVVWVLVVDRDTLRGATDRPEESIENTWLQGASSGSFFDLLTIASLGTVILAFSQWSLSGQMAFVIIVGLGMASFSLRYLLASRRS